jgi:hypothetical protein
MMMPGLVDGDFILVSFVGARKLPGTLAARKCQRAEVFNNAVDALDGIQRLLEAIGV